MKQVNAAQFEAESAERCGWSVEEFRQLGFRVMHCHCDDPKCPGWYTTHPESALADAVERIAEQFATAGDMVGRFCGSVIAQVSPVQFEQLVNQTIEKLRGVAKKQEDTVQ